MIRKLYRNAKRVKTISAFAKQSDSSNLKRHLSLFDLICVGVGSTLGSGVFVLTGYVANKYAGPAVMFSWLIAGMVSACSATSFAELCCIIPSSGSIYAYTYVTLGEWLGYLAGACLTLECGISAAAIARNWGVKLSNYLTSTSTTDVGINYHAGLLMTIVVLIFLSGVETSKRTINIFTVGRMFLFAFMISMGLALFNTEHVRDFVPMGVGGMLKGVTPLFFGIVGFEEICCLHEEAIEPYQTLPTAIFITIGIITLVYCLCALALVGTVDYNDIDRQSGFSIAFRDRGVHFAAHITVVGELLSLPLVVLASFLPQPRILMAMAEDKLLPNIFTIVNTQGNLFYGTALSGLVCIFIALTVPFSYLDEVVSAGILVGFNLTNTAVLLIRCGHTADDYFNIEGSVQSEEQQWYITRNLGRIPLTWLLIVYSLLSIISSLLVTDIVKHVHVYTLSYLIVMCVWIALFILMLVAIALHIYFRYKPWRNNVQNRYTTFAAQSQSHATGTAYYRVPFMPFTPLVGIFLNFYLICQLQPRTVGYMALFFVISSLFYFAYGIYYQLNKSGYYRGANGTGHTSNTTSHHNGNHRHREGNSSTYYHDLLWSTDSSDESEDETDNEDEEKVMKMGCKHLVVKSRDQSTQSAQNHHRQQRVTSLMGNGGNGNGNGSRVSDRNNLTASKNVQMLDIIQHQLQHDTQSANGNSTTPAAKKKTHQRSTIVYGGTFHLLIDAASEERKTLHDEVLLNKACTDYGAVEEKGLQ